MHMKIPLLSPLLSRIDGFIRAMLVMVVLALLFPSLGASSGPLHLDIVTLLGVSLVFFLHGAALSREKIVEGARNWRLHLFVQSCTFVLFPLIGAVILLIVFNSFADSTHAGVWSKYPWETIVAVAIMSGALLFVVLGMTTWIARRFGFGLADEITAVFCGSKKSLANGVPMAKILFAGNPALGLIVLPIMIYHQLQLIVCSTLARKYADRVAHAERAADTGAGQPA
jgi:predicted Na+-dependent transporter